MDLVNDADPIPTWKNGVVAKVTRISMEDDDSDDEDDHVFQNSTPIPTPVPSNPRAPPSHQSSMASQGSADHLDIFDGPTLASSATTPAAEPNLFDAHPSVPTSAPTSGSSLLDMSHSYGSQPQTSSVHADFLGMTAPTPAAATPQAGYPGSTNPNMYQQQAPQQQKSFNNFSNQQGAFGGLGTPWK
jgi:hypothetical protein